MKKIFLKLKTRLQNLSFRTGLIVLGFCILFYLLSLAPVFLPISLAWRGALWAVFFGLAKTCQYAALLILGKEGWKRLKSKILTKPKTT